MSKATVLITGAGIGIGHCSALAFAAKGYHVYVTDVLDKEGAETVSAIEAAGGTAEFHHLDVTDTANVDAVVKSRATATPPISRRSVLSPPRSNAWPSRSAICSAPKYARRRNISPRAKRAPRPCRTSATRC